MPLFSFSPGPALLEQSETDPALGRFLHRNYSGYLVPANADIPTSTSCSPATSTATGKRVRDLPITIEKLL